MEPEPEARYTAILQRNVNYFGTILCPTFSSSLKKDKSLNAID